MFVFISFTGNGPERLQDSDCGECETESGVSTSVGDRPGNCLYENARNFILKIHIKPFETIVILA